MRSEERNFFKWSILSSYEEPTWTLLTLDEHLCILLNSADTFPFWNVTQSSI